MNKLLIFFLSFGLAAQTYQITDLGTGFATDIENNKIIGNDVNGAWVHNTNRATLKFQAGFPGTPTNQLLFFTALTADNIISNKITGSLMFIPQDESSKQSYIFDGLTAILIGSYKELIQKTNTINYNKTNSGVKVGSFKVGDQYHAFIDDGNIKDLNNMVSALGWVLTSANSIHSNKIVGAGTKDGVKKAFLLTPLLDLATNSEIKIGLKFCPVITITNQINKKVQIQSSNDLKFWKPLTNLTIGSNVFNWVDLEDSGRKFYRVIKLD